MCFTKSCATKNFSFVFFLLMLSNSSMAQYVNDSARVRWDLIQKKNSSFFRPAVLNTLTAGCIAYGFLSIENDEVKGWNMEAREEIWEEHPHTFNHLDNYLQYAPALAVYGLNVSGVKGKNSIKNSTLALAGAMMVTGTLVTTLKTVTHVQRPDKSSFNSFPSGHTATAFMTAEFLRQEYKDVSPWIPVGGYLVAATTGYMRMYNNRHWATDVFAGAAIGVISTQVTYYCIEKIRARKHKPNLEY